MMKQLIAVIILAMFLAGCAADNEMTHSDALLVEQDVEQPSDIVVGDAIGSQLIAENDYIEIGEMI